MKTSAATSSRPRLPAIGTWKRKCAASRISADLDVADEDVGDDLAEQHLERPRRHREQVLHRAALALAGDRERR